MTRLLGIAIAFACFGTAGIFGVIPAPLQTTGAARLPAPDSEFVVRASPDVNAPPVPAPVPPIPPDARTRATRAVPARAAAPVAPAAWATFTGDIGDGPFRIARANAGALAVSMRPDAPAALTLSNPLPSGAPRVALVVAEARDWYAVLVPRGRNGRVGWVRAADVTIASTTYRGVVDRAAHRLVVSDGARPVLDEPVAVGKPRTPTPPGVFFLTELLQPPDPNGAYGPYAFSLSGRAPAGELGLHGTNEPSSIGRDASNGCVRTTNDTIRRLASLLPLGTPITIR